MISPLKLEKRILLISTAFLFSLLALVVFGNMAMGIGLPTCITDIKPFDKGEIFSKGATRYEVHYVARMWQFEPANVEIPIGSTVDLYLSSIDVTHGFNILNTNVNLMAVPGVVNYAQVKFDKAGDYEIVCHEYCGMGHQSMAATLRVYDPAIPRAILSPQPTAESNQPGYLLLQQRSCAACHTIDGRPGTGPSFKGLFGRTETFADNTKALVDEAYIRESIQQPNAKIVNGYSPIMPILPVTDSEIAQIIQYIRTLK